MQMARPPMMAAHPAMQAPRGPAGYRAAPNAQRPMPSAAYRAPHANPAGMRGAAQPRLAASREMAHPAFHPEPGRDAPRETAMREPEHHDLARNDPARAHGEFDEHTRNPDREHDIARLHEHDFHARDVRAFNGRELASWRGGFWRHDYYDGRFGWWYDVGGVFYPYAAPVWPYPLTVAPLIYADLPASPPPPPGVPTLPALPRVAYHCASPAGFFPAVAGCDTGWVALAAR